MKKISAVLVAAAFMFVMSASAFASDAPKADAEKDAVKIEEKKDGEVKPVDPAAPKTEVKKDAPKKVGKKKAAKKEAKKTEEVKPADAAAPAPAPEAPVPAPEAAPAK